MTFDHLLSAQKRFYDSKLEEHGATPRGVDWNDTSAQELRFDQLSRIFDGASGFTVNDFGCGYGAFAGYLASRAIEAEYHGFDITPAMVEHGRAAFGGPAVSFVTREEELPVADYTVANAIFNSKLDADAGEWTNYVVETLGRMRALSSKGLAFNMLTAYSDADKMRDDLYYADPLFFVDLCVRTMSRRVVLLHDYAWEFTILVRLEDSILPARPAGPR